MQTVEWNARATKVWRWKQTILDIFGDQRHENIVYKAAASRCTNKLGFEILIERTLVKIIPVK